MNVFWLITVNLTISESGVVTKTSRSMIEME